MEGGRRAVGSVTAARGGCTGDKASVVDCSGRVDASRTSSQVDGAGKFFDSDISQLLPRQAAYDPTPKVTRPVRRTSYVVRTLRRPVSGGSLKIWCWNAGRFHPFTPRAAMGCRSSKADMSHEGDAYKTPFTGDDAEPDISPEVKPRVLLPPVVCASACPVRTSPVHCRRLCRRRPAWLLA